MTMMIAWLVMWVLLHGHDSHFLPVGCYRIDDECYHNDHNDHNDHNEVHIASVRLDTLGMLP